MSYFDIASGLPGASDKSRVLETPSEPQYRYYKCSKNTCNKVIHADKHTINIPNYIPEALDLYLIRYQLKTFLPITIS
jgi:hypothetical protein